ncbi:MAG: hypothetical protein ACLGI2_11100 [Acidimicrobiia bacterium]
MHGREKRTAGDEVLDAIDALLVALRESAVHNRNAARRAQTIRRVRSHGRRYTEILERTAASASHRLTSQAAMAAVRASERLERAEVQALLAEGLEADRIADICGMTPADVEVVIAAQQE